MSEATAAHSTPAVEAAYARVSRRIVPVLFLAYVASYIDSFNIGFAQLQMKGHIGLSDTLYGIGASLLVVGQLLFIVPSNLLLHRYGARATLLRVMACWALGSFALAFVTTPLQFVVLRFVTGVLTAGFFAGLILYLTYWYPSGRRARVVSIFMLAPVVAGMIVGPVSGAIIGSMQDIGGLHGWQWMFILEALPCVVVALLIYPRLADHPAQARWLSAGELEIVRHNLEVDRAAMSTEALSSAQDAFRNPRVYALGAAAALITFGMIGTAFFLPHILQDMGVKRIQDIGLLAAVPYVIGGTAMVLYSRHSDRTLERRWHLVGAMASSALGFVVLALQPGLAGGLAGLCLVIGGLLAGPPVFWPMPAAFLTGRAAAAGIALIMVIAEVGGAAAPTVLGLIRSSTGNLQAGMLLVAVLLLAGGATILAAVPKGLLHERRPD